MIWYYPEKADWLNHYYRYINRSKYISYLWKVKFDKILFNEKIGSSWHINKLVLSDLSIISFTRHSRTVYTAWQVIMWNLLSHIFPCFLSLYSGHDQSLGCIMPLSLTFSVLVLASISPSSTITNKQTTNLFICHLWDVCLYFSVYSWKLFPLSLPHSIFLQHLPSSKPLYFRLLILYCIALCVCLFSPKVFKLC